MVERNVEALNDLAQFIEERIPGSSFYCMLELSRPEAKPDIFALDALFLVHNVIRRAAPCVDHVDGIALRLWKKKKRVIEITPLVLFDDVGNEK